MKQSIRANKNQTIKIKALEDQRKRTYEKDNVVDADFEDVKEDKEKAPKIKIMRRPVAKRDCYDVLGIPKGASKEDIKSLQKISLKIPPR